MCTDLCVCPDQGRTAVQLQNGLAYFTNLGIDLSGNGYTLKFTYSGLTQLRPVKSSPFRVEKPVKILEMIQRDLFGGVVTAGDSFDIDAMQPVVELRGDDNERLANTVLPVTATINQLYNPGNWQDWNFCKDHFDCTNPADPETRYCGGPFDATRFCACAVPGQGVTQVHNALVDSCPSTLLGQTVGIPVEGTVRFTDLALSKASVGQYLNITYPGSPQSYVLTLSLGKIAIETPFDALFVVPAEWEGIMIPPFGQPLAQNIAGEVLAVQPTVILVDRFNNRVLGEQIPPRTDVSVSIHSFDGAGIPPIVRRGCYGRGEFNEEIWGKPLPTIHSVLRPFGSLHVFCPYFVY